MGLSRLDLLAGPDEDEHENKKADSEADKEEILHNALG